MIAVIVVVVVVVVTLVMFLCVWRQSVEYDSFFLLAKF